MSRDAETLEASRCHDNSRNNSFLLGVTIHLNPWERHIKFRCFYYSSSQLLSLSLLLFPANFP